MSIQNQIKSDLYRMVDRAVTPEQIKSLQAHLVASVQNGSVPSYVGVPLLSDLNQKMSKIGTAPAQAQQMVNQPPIAQQVMGQAEQGLAALPSNLPAEGMAGGGIVAFDEGGYLDEDEYGDDEDDLEGMDLDIGIIPSSSYGSFGEPVAAPAYSAMSYSKDTSSVKAEGQPAHGRAHEEVTATGKRGLDELLRLIEKKESGGRRYDKEGNLLTSPKGAMGEMQVMPATARDPGFGIRPAREGDPDDIARVGRELFAKMMQRYQDPRLAAAAYNWGPGNVDKWIASGADESRLPRETRNYIAGMKEGGIARLASGDLVGPYRSEAERMLAEARVRAAERAVQRAAAASAPPAPVAPQTAAVEDLTLGQRLGRFLVPSGIGAPASAVGIGGGLASLFGQGVVGGASREGREQLTADIGSDTGLAAAIMNAREEDPRQNVANVVQQKPSAQKQTSIVGAGRGITPASTYAKAAKKADLDSQLDEAASSFQGITQASGSPAQEPALEKPEQTAAKPSGIESAFGEYAADIKKQRDINNYLALLSAGFGMMGGRSPYAFQNIGAGGQQGIATFAQLNQATSADERALLAAKARSQNAQAQNDYYRSLLEERKRAAMESADIKRQAETDKNIGRSASIINKMEQKAIDDSRLIAKSLIDSAAKDILNPLTEEQKQQIYTDQRAIALAKLNRNKSYLQHIKVAIPGYDPSQLDLSKEDTSLINKYLKPKS